MTRDERRTYISDLVAEDLVQEALQSRLTQSTATRREPSLLTSTISQANKTAYLRGVYSADPKYFGSIVGSSPLSRSTVRSTMADSLFKQQLSASKTCSSDDIDNFHDIIKRQLNLGTDKLHQHLELTCAARNHADDLKYNVLAPASRMKQALTDFQKDIESNTLVKADIDLRGKLYRSEELDRLSKNDPQSQILVEANCSYYGKKLVEVLQDLGQELKLAKLPAQLMAKRDVGKYKS